MTNKKRIFFYFFLFFIVNVNTSYAYLGLGPLIPVLGNVLMFLLLGIASILGIFFSPIKKLVQKIKKKKIKGNS